MGRPERRGGDNLVRGPVPARARWRLQARPGAVVGGALGGASGAVLAQQYRDVLLTGRLLLVAVVTGVLVGVAIASLAHLVAVRRRNRRHRRARATPAVAVVLVAAVGSLLVATAAGATMTGPCIATVDGTDVAERPADAARAVAAGDDARLRIVVVSWSAITGGRFVVEYGGRTFTLREVAPGDDLAPAEGNVLEVELALDETPWLGAGLYKMHAEVELEGGGSCDAAFVADTEREPLSTWPGRAAAATFVLSLALVAGSTIGAWRSVGVRHLDDLRRTFANLEAARSRTAQVGLPAGPPWAPRAAHRAAPLPANAGRWWQQQHPVPDEPEPVHPVECETTGLASVAPVIPFAHTDPVEAPPPPDRPADEAEPAEPSPGGPPGDPPAEPLAAPRLELVVAPGDPEVAGAEADPDEEGDRLAWLPQPEAPPDELAQVLTFAPRPAGDPEPQPEPESEAEPEPHPATEAGAGAADDWPDPRFTFGAGSDVLRAGAQDVEPTEPHEPDIRSLDEILTAALTRPEPDDEAEQPAPSADDIDLDGAPVGEPEPSAAEPHTVVKFVPVPLVVEPDEHAPARPGVRAVARAIEGDATGVGVLGPPDGTEVEVGDESRDALARWSGESDAQMIPTLDVELDEIIADLPASLVTRGRLSASIDRAELRARVDEWARRVGRPPALLASAQAWQALLRDEVLAGLLAPSDYVNEIAARAAAPARDEHDWDLCVQEVTWPWA